MREILFRGKQVDNGEWVEGFYLILPIGETVILSNRGYAKVIPETIGQFTGLCDKNGTEIFEGDILQTEGTDFRDVVCFGRFNDDDNRGNECIGFYVKSGNYTTSLLEMPLDNYCYVVGNIYDNSELIQEG